MAKPDKAQMLFANRRRTVVVAFPIIFFLFTSTPNVGSLTKTWFKNFSNDLADHSHSYPCRDSRYFFSRLLFFSKYFCVNRFAESTGM